MRVHLVSLYVSLNKVFCVGNQRRPSQKRHVVVMEKARLPFNPVSATNKFYSMFLFENH